MEITVKVVLKEEEVKAALETYLLTKGIKVEKVNFRDRDAFDGTVYNLEVEVEGVCQSLRKG